MGLGRATASHASVGEQRQTTRFDDFVTVERLPLPPLGTVMRSARNALALHRDSSARSLSATFNVSLDFMPTAAISPQSSSLKRLIIGVCVLAFTAALAHAESWWNAEWTARKKITLDTTSAGVDLGGEPGTAAFLVRLHDGNFQFLAVKEDGSDLRFVAADDKTVLPHHIEKWDTLLNEAYVWVKAPADFKAGAAATVWLYHSNHGNAPKAEDAKATYDADTALVFHFSERGSAPNDATGGGTNAGNAGAAAEGAMIGGGLRLLPKTMVSVPPTAQVIWGEGGTMTWMSWVRFTAPKAGAIVFSRAENDKSLTVGIDSGVPFLEVKNGAEAAQRTQPGEALVPNAWRHIAVVASAGTMTLYLDGKTYGAVNAALPSLNSALQIGSDTDKGFEGELDEMSLHKNARSAGFIKFAATNQGGSEAAGKLLVFGMDEAPQGMFSWLEGGHFGIIIKNLTFDGWVVIILCAVLSLISWFVMIGKNSYISSLRKNNDRFMEQWHHLAADLTALDSGDDDNAKTLGGRVDTKGLRKLRKSSIYRIYHAGVAEIRHRLGKDASDSGKVLSSRTMQAIRATMEGTLIREKQKLDSSIVFLTLSISGGPFLGLLGTVVGVMITFAAVAAAGEVNVNAIAPGIAAALLATVAGLAVAIPALFGYNYLLSRIKEVMADMQVFIDEFVTKVAEVYRD